MNCQHIQEKFSEFRDGSLPVTDAAALRTHLTGCPVCQRAWTEWQQFTDQLGTLAAMPAPSPRLREQFYAMLEMHEREAETPSPFAPGRGRFDRFLAAIFPRQPSTQFALACALLCGGLVIGREFAAQPTISAAQNSATRQELAALRTQVDSVGRLVTYSLLQQQSTSGRLRAVLATMDLPSPDRKILTDLVGTLVFDPSLNVRLSAVEALAPHADDSLVRAGVLSALPRETAPLVQVAMIELLATSGDNAAQPVLEKLSRDEALDRNVRDAARRALTALRQAAHPAEIPGTTNSSIHQPAFT